MTSEQVIADIDNEITAFNFYGEVLRACDIELPETSDEVSPIDKVSAGDAIVRVRKRLLKNMLDMRSAVDFPEDSPVLE